MNFFEAIILGLIQGITEFLPISSSGHLVIAEQLLHIKMDTGVLFEVMLHMGTLAAVCITFRSDLKRMFWEMIHIFSDLYLIKYMRWKKNNIKKYCITTIENWLL